MDIYRFSSEVIKFLERHPKYRGSKHLKLMKGINLKAEICITEKLIKILKDPTLLNSEECKTYVNWEIINEYFSEFIVMTT